MLKIRLFIGLTLVMATVMFAADVSWKDADSSGLWSDGTKWSTGAKPQAGDRPVLDKNNIVVTRTAADANDVFNVFNGPGVTATNVVLNIEGGSMIVNRVSPSNETFRTAYGTGSSGRVNMSGGFMEVGDFVAGLGDYQVARNGIGELFMTGGEIRIARYLTVGAASSGRGHVKIYDDAVIRVGNSMFRGSTSYSRVDVGGGQLIFAGDKRTHVATWRTGGWLVAYDGHPRAEFVITYDATANETVVTSTLPDLNLAYNPSPANGSLVVRNDLTQLAWSAGDNATEHHIYFGLDYDDVDNADVTDTTGIFKGVQPLAQSSYPLSGPLELGQVYYWRVDQSDGQQIWKGEVWSFDLNNFVVVDNMDSYLSATEQWQISGSGSLSLNTDVKRSAPQSLKIDFWGSNVVVSREFDSPQDWTFENVAALFMAFKGTDYNPLTPILVKLVDVSNNSATAEYSDPNKLTDDQTYLPWNHLNVSLADFSGVDLTNVKKISIELTNPLAGTGTIYVDDIQLFIPRCITSMGNYSGDLNGDCLVDIDDFIVLASDWLKSDTQGYGLVGNWKFTEGSGSLAADSSLLGNDGTLLGTPTWTTGHAGGGALDFTAVGQGVRIPNSGSISVGRGDFTLSAWVITRSLYTGTKGGIIFKGKDSNDKEYAFSIGDSRLYLDIESNGDNGYSRTNQYVINEWTWQHVATTFDSQTMKVAFYVNGSLVPNERDMIFNLPRYQNDDLYIGIGSYSGWQFNGRIEDPRIYDQKLSAAEIAALAQGTEPTITPVVRPLISVADINDDGIVDPDDIIEMSASWVQDMYMWPVTE